MEELREPFFDFLDAQPTAVFAVEDGRVVHVNPAGLCLAPDALGGDAGALFGEELARPGLAARVPWRGLDARGEDLGRLRLITAAADGLPLWEDRALLNDVTVGLREKLSVELYQLMELEKKAREAGDIGAIRDLASMDRRLCQALRIVRNLGRLCGDGDNRPRLAGLELGAMVRDLLATVAYFCKGRGVELELDCPQPVELMGDRRLLEIMVMELIVNAVKHTASGGKVSVSVGVSAGLAVIRVANGGTDRDNARLKDLEDRFDIPAPALDPEAGAGLGLQVSRRMAALHGGAVILQTLPDGSGTAATAALPIRPPEDDILAEPIETGSTAFDLLIDLSDIADASVYELRETL